MVSAGSLNLDVLEIIFAYLSGKDLAAVALVNKPFLAAVIPHLYRFLSFRTRHAKKYPKVSTSFSSILAHPGLAVHVKTIEIRDTPMTHGTNKDFSRFIRDCSRVVSLCMNMESFTYTKDTVAAILPMLQGKKRLNAIRLHSRLSTQQAEMVIKLQKVQKVTLDYASWNMLDLLPKWAEILHQTLSSLTLYMSTDLNREVLDQTLRELSHLTELHIVGCPYVDHIAIFSFLSHIPHLESLAFTASDVPCSLDRPPPLYSLRHLAIDLRSSPISETPSSQATLISIISYIKVALPPLSSLTLKVRELRPTTSQPVVKQILDSFAYTLRRLVLVDCGISIESLGILCKGCIHLEHLSIPLPVKDVFSFTHALANSSTIRTVIDADAHLEHVPHTSLKRDNVIYMMRCIPSLQKVVGDRRIWTGRRDANGKLHVSFEPQTGLGPTAHWFLPPRIR